MESCDHNQPCRAGSHWISIFALLLVMVPETKESLRHSDVSNLACWQVMLNKLSARLHASLSSTAGTGRDQASVVRKINVRVPWGPFECSGARRNLTLIYQ